MLNRINQLGLSLAVLAFAGLGTAHAQDENPCEDMDNPCEDTGDEGDMDNPCGESNPCEDADADADATTDDGGGEEAAADDGAAAGHSMITATGKIKINVAVGVGLSTDFVGDPIALAPDVIYGVMDKLDVGLYHTAMGITGFWSQPGGGLCLAGDLCADVYNGPTGVLANFSLAEGKLSVAANGGALASNIAGDTMLLSLKAGAKINYALSEQMGLQVDPSIIIGLNERDFNKEFLNIPVAFMYAVDEKIHAGVQTGLAGPLDGLGDAYAIPLNLGGMYAVDAKLGVGAAFGFSNIAGKNSTADARDLTIFAKYAL